MVSLGLVVVWACKPPEAPKAFEPCADPAVTTMEAGPAAVQAADAVVAGLGPKLRACYETARRSEPLLQGCIVVVAKVDGGKVEENHVDTLHGLDAETAECIRAVVSQASFDPSAKGRVAVPLTFTSGK
jgi:hypothetical protein